jgi:hypothetical protein
MFDDMSVLRHAVEAQRTTVRFCHFHRGQAAAPARLAGQILEASAPLMSAVAGTGLPKAFVEDYSHFSAPGVPAASQRTTTMRVCSAAIGWTKRGPIRELPVEVMRT